MSTHPPQLFSLPPRVPSIYCVLRSIYPIPPSHNAIRNHITIYLIRSYGVAMDGPLQNLRERQDEANIACACAPALQRSGISLLLDQSLCVCEAMRRRCHGAGCGIHYLALLLRCGRGFMLFYCRLSEDCILSTWIRSTQWIVCMLV